MINTYSKFYYGHEIDEDNYKLDFDEGGSQLTAELNYGEYTLTEFVVELQRALNAAGALTYTCSVNRSTRIITIAASGNFTLRVATGTNSGTSVFALVGFTGSNRTGSATYAGDTASGSVYSPQFLLQDYVPAENNQKASDVTVNESATGIVEMVRFGIIEMIEMNIRFITNIVQPSGGPIISDTSGVSNANTFMRYIVNKYPVEFIPDVDTPATFHKVILESTANDSKGAAYKLRERFDIGIPGYYETGLLTFRVVE